MDTRKDGKTPDLSAQEKHEVDRNQPPRAAVLHEIIRTQGNQELERSVAALWWSALAAGLTVRICAIVAARFAVSVVTCRHAETR